MCFYKTKESKVLVAKRNIKVYKIGTYASDTSFKPFFYNNFEYPVNYPVCEVVVFDIIIDQGLHSYLNCLLDSEFLSTIDLYTSKGLQYTISLLRDKIFLGEFIIPKGASYCLNNNVEVVSDVLIYTGKYVELKPYKQYNTKELWKEKQVKYLLITVKLIK